VIADNQVQGCRRGDSFGIGLTGGAHDGYTNSVCLERGSIKVTSD
jgi:hypothetical protein